MPVKESRAASARSWDILIALLLLIIGLGGLLCLWRPALFGLASTGSAGSSFIAEVVREAGDVRHQDQGSIVWHDLSETSANVRFGDAIYTGDTGNARVVFNAGKVQAEIPPDSLVVIEQSMLTHGGSFWSRLLGNAGRPKIQVIGLKKGEIHLQSLHAGSAIDIEADGKIYRLKTQAGSGDLNVRLTPSPSGDHLEVAAAAGTAVHVSNPGDELQEGVDVSGRKIASLALPKTENAKAELPAGLMQPNMDFSHWSLPFLKVRSPYLSTRILDRRFLDFIPVRLSWDPISKAKSYRVRVFHGDQPVVDTELTDPAKGRFAFQLKELDDDPYSFQISVTLGSGQILEGARTPLDVHFVNPIVKFPARGQGLRNGAKFMITWEQTLFTSKYRVQVAADRAFRKMLLDRETDVNLQAFEAPAAGVFYVRVKSVSGKRDSTWSKARELSVR